MAAYTDKQRDALRAAIASGALTVEGADIGRVTYRSLDEMQRALSMVEAGLAAQNAGRRCAASPDPAGRRGRAAAGGRRERVRQRLGQLRRRHAQAAGDGPVRRPRRSWCRRGGDPGLRRRRRHRAPVARGWRVGSFGPNTAITYSLDELRRKSRDQTRKNPLAGAAVDKLVSNIVGTGVSPRSTAARSTVGMSKARAKKVQQEDAAFRAEIQRLHLAWTDEADAVGRPRLFRVAGARRARHGRGRRDLHPPAYPAAVRRADGPATAAIARGRPLPAPQDRPGRRGSAGHPVRRDRRAHRLLAVP